MAWEESSRICLHMQLIAILSRIGVWTNPFDNNYKAYENELLNRDIYKHTIGYSKGNGNQISLNLSWRLSRGSKHKSAEKRINLRDTDNGIIK